MKFDSLDLSPDILKAVREAGFERCTPVQEQALPDTLAGKDLIAQSQTGTGKTAVFLLTILNRLKDKRPEGRPWALVMVPTRELAVQVEKDAVMLGKHLDFRSVAVYGGVEYEKQIPALKEGVDLVVATPGRMIDLYKSKNLSLDGIEMFVVDEADRMFDMGFAPDIRYIANRLPKDLPRQTMLFSATIDHNVRRLSTRYMKKEAEEIEVDPEQVTVDKIDQKLVYTSNEEKVPMLMALLERPGVEKVLIFTNMKRTAEMVGWKLTENGYPAEVLTGDVNQNKRQRIIEGLKTGKVKMLVATDVAARGLHIDGVTHVVNFDLPEESASYVHRIGRTARAGESGKAWSLVCESHAFNLPDIEKYIERKIESEWIEDTEIPEDKAGPYRRRRPPAGKGGGRSGDRGRSGKSGGRSGQRSGKPRSGGPSKGSKGRKSSGKPSEGSPKRVEKAEKPAEAKAEAGAESGDKPSQGSEPGKSPSGSGDKPQRKRRRRSRGRGRGRGGRSGEKSAGAEKSGKPAEKPDRQEAAGKGEKKGRGGEPRKKSSRKPSRRETGGGGGGRKQPASGGRSSSTHTQSEAPVRYGEEFSKPAGAGRKVEEKVEREIDRMASSARQKINRMAGPDKGKSKNEDGGVLKKMIKAFLKK